MSQITLRYFAAAAEAAGREEDTWELPADTTLDAVRDQLTERYGDPMRKVLRSGSFLVDGIVRRDGGSIGTANANPNSGTGRNSDTNPSTVTIDVLPPFAGG